MPKIVGYPFRPKMVEKANCGPTVLAAVLGVDAGKAIKLMDNNCKKGWNGYTNIGHIKNVLRSKGLTLIKFKDFDNRRHLPTKEENKFNEPIIFFLQIEGHWSGKGWRSDYSHTHYCLLHHEMVMDVNNYTGENSPEWFTINDWDQDVTPFFVDVINKGTGWYIRAAYRVMED